VHPSDIAPALVALDARVKTSKRTIGIDDFFDVGVSKTTVLEDDEIVTEIEVDTLGEDSKSAFMKFAHRSSIDFSIVDCAVKLRLSGGKVSDARICLNAVYVKPYRALRAEQAMMGKKVTEANAEAAGLAAVYSAKPVRHNAYMVQIAKTLVKRTILAC
jgi:CO/xanthine dehydrogenase FAD-binding subunit